MECDVSDRRWQETKNLLIIFNARDIPRCLDAFGMLHIDKAWLRGFTYKQLNAPLTKLVESTDYDNYIIASDDLVPTQLGLDKITEGLESHDILTGWCNMRPGVRRGNVRLSPIMLNRPAFLAGRCSKLMERMKVYTFPRFEDLAKQPEYFRTYLMADCFTGMRREHWLRFPYYCYSEEKEFGNDYTLSRRLHEAGLTMWCRKSAFFYHLNSIENLIVGKVAPEVIFEK